MKRDVVNNLGTVYEYKHFSGIFGMDATQTGVFEVIAKDVVDSAFNGYNGTIFAYGQTGSGKSYSIFGYGENKGIVP